MTIPRVPTGTAQALSPGQRHALQHFYGALATRNVDLVDQALTSDWEDIPLAPGQAAGPEGVNRLPTLTLDRRPILTPSGDGFGR